MNICRKFASRIALLTIAFAPWGLYAGGFDGYVIPDTGPGHDSVLVHSPEFGAESEVVIADDDLGEMGWSNASAACCGVDGCSGGCSTCNSDAGWINRIPGRWHATAILGPPRSTLSCSGRATFRAGHFSNPVA